MTQLPQIKWALLCLYTISFELLIFCPPLSVYRDILKMHIACCLIFIFRFICIKHNELLLKLDKKYWAYLNCSWFSLNKATSFSMHKKNQKKEIQRNSKQIKFYIRLSVRFWFFFYLVKFYSVYFVCSWMQIYVIN